MLELKKASLKISNRFVIGPLTAEINKGSAVAIIGESGCGKTTLLQMIYGLYDLDSGTIFWNTTQVTGPEENLVPGMPFIKYLSQDFDLMPFTTVEENVKKFLSRLKPRFSQQRTNELLEVVEMTAYAKVKVKTLSGGQKQRVALAQTLAKEPELLLLDEPFSHIDNFRKNKLRRNIFSYLKKQNITCLVATHDSTDVLSYTDQTIVMRDGKIIVQDNTQSIYNSPPSYYVGSLFNDINELPLFWFDSKAQEQETILLYPHQLLISQTGIKTVVTACYYMGNYYLIIGTHMGVEILFNSQEEILENDTVFLTLVD